RDDLNAAGFSEAPAPEVTPPDVLLLLSIQQDDWVVVWDTWGWYPGWGWWGGGWGPGWSLVYPSAVASVSFTTGTLHIDMVRPDPTSTTSSIPVVWTAAINGLLSETVDFERLGFLVDQAFAQSPYLRSTP